jgi:hypothetical protein
MEQAQPYETVKLLGIRAAPKEPHPKEKTAHRSRFRVSEVNRI